MENVRLTRTAPAEANIPGRQIWRLTWLSATTYCITRGVVPLDPEHATYPHFRTGAACPYPPLNRSDHEEKGDTVARMVADKRKNGWVDDGG